MLKFVRILLQGQYGTYGTMKVVGLLSGGKDSCYNLCHCVAQGHEVVVLASLGPEGGKGAGTHLGTRVPRSASDSTLLQCIFSSLLHSTLSSALPSTEEIDSYMYQTVGQDGLQFIAEALDLPLIRGTISGKAVDQGSDYAATSSARTKGHVEGDETEDLFRLLEKVKVCRIRLLT